MFRVVSHITISYENHLQFFWRLVWRLTIGGKFVMGSSSKPTTFSHLTELLANICFPVTVRIHTLFYES